MRYLFLFFSFFFSSFFSPVFFPFFHFTFFFSFFICFGRKKFLLFFFFLFFFQICLLLALVSEFNCFFRRCSMVMWCPDDIGRDSWDWVGPPAWERASTNSPEWGGGSSPVSMEPPQIVLLLLYWTSALRCDVYGNKSSRSIGITTRDSTLTGESEKCALSAKSTPHHEADSSTSTQRNNVRTPGANTACKDSNRSIEQKRQNPSPRRRRKCV